MTNAAKTSRCRHPTPELLDEPFYQLHGLSLRAIRKYHRTAKTIKIAAETINLNSISTPEVSSGYALKYCPADWRGFYACVGVESTTTAPMRGFDSADS